MVSTEVTGRGPAHERMAAIAEHAGLRRIQVLTMRAADDPEAGGAEEHADQIARHWAASGIEVQVRAAAVPGHPAVTEQDGYRTVRRGGPVTVFPRSAAAAALRRDGPWDALLEVSHGLPFWSPLWTRRPKVLFVHHVLQGVWHLQTGGGPIARLGEVLERVALPRVYRGSAVMAPSPSTRDALVDLGLRSERVGVALNGIADRFCPGGERSPTPLLVAAGRLTPQKGFDRLLEVLAALDRPDVRLQVVGDGRSQPDLERQAAELGVADQVTFLGRIDDDALVEAYRRAWLLVSASHREGWGLTITEAAACGAPAVVTHIPGHVDAVVTDETGLLAGSVSEMAEAVARLVDDPTALARLSEGALAWAAELRWDAAAEAILQTLAAQVRRS